MKSPSSFTTIPVGARFAVILFALLGFAAVLYAAALQNNFQPVRLALLLGAAVIGSRAKINLFKGTTLSFLTAVILLAVIHEGLGPALLVAIVGVTAQSLLPFKKVALYHLAFNAGMIAVSVTATWWAYQLLLTIAPLDAISSQVTATVLASLTYFLGNSLSVSLIIGLTKGMSMLNVWMNHFLCSAPSFLMAGLLSLSFISVLNSHSTVLTFGMAAALSLFYFSSVFRLAAAPAKSA